MNAKKYKYKGEKNYEGEKNTVCNADLLLAYSKDGVGAEIKENGSDKYIEMGKTVTGNMLLGAYIKNVGSATSIADAKIITDAKFTTSAPNTYLNQVGGSWHYYYANSTNGYAGANDNLIVKNFVAISASGNAEVDAEYNKATRQLTLSLVNPEDDLYTISAKNVLSADGFGFVDTFIADRRDAFSISSIKVVDADGNDTDYYAENSFRVVGTFEKNTTDDVDGHVIVALYDDSEREYNYEISYLNEERKLSLKVTDKIYDGFEYNISFAGVESKDGFVMTGEDISFTHQNENDIVISPAIESYSYNGEENTLVLNMNTEIDDTSIDDIKIYDLRKKRIEMPYYISCDGNVITIKIDYDMYYDCEYELDISGVKSTEGFGVKDENSILKFTHDDEADILNLLTVESISPDPKQIQQNKDGVTTYNTVAPYMSPNQGYIRIKFDKPVDSKTVEGIEFTDSDGNEPVGGVYYNVADNAVEVTFGELKPETEYTLKVTKALKGRDKSFIDDEIEYKWTTLEKLYIEEDLSEYDVGYAEAFKQTFSVLMSIGSNGLVISSRNGYNTTVEVKETTAGKKYALITEAVEGKKIHVGWFPSGEMDKYGNTKPFIVEGTFMTKAEVNKHQAAAGNDIVMGTLHNWNFADGYSSLRIDALKDFTEEDGLYNIQLSTRKYNTEAATLNASGVMTFNANYDITAFDILSGARVESNYSMQKNTSARDLDTYSVINSYTGSGMSGNGFKFSYIKTGLFMDPGFLGEPEYNPEENTVTYQLNTDINEETLKNASLTNKITGNKVLAEFVYDDKTRVVTARLGENLEYQTNYITDFTKVESADGFVFTEKYEFRNLLEIEDIVENREVSNDFGNGYINLTFKNEVSINKDDILIKNPEGEEIDFNVEVSGKNALITFVNEYDYENEYTLIVKKSILSKAHGDLKFETDMVYSFKLKDILSVSAFKKNSGGYSAKISNNTDEAIEVFVTIAIYDEKGRVLNTVFDVYNIAKGEQKTVSAKLTQAAGAKKAKVFVLSNQPELDTMYKASTLELN